MHKEFNNFLNELETLNQKQESDLKRNIYDIKTRIERDKQIIKDFGVEELFQNIIDNNIVKKANIRKFKIEEKEFKNICLNNKQDTINVYISLDFDFIPRDRDSDGSISRIIFMVSRGKLCFITNQEFNIYNNDYNLKTSIVVENEEQLPSLIVRGIKNPTKERIYSY